MKLHRNVILTCCAAAALTLALAGCGQQNAQAGYIGMDAAKAIALDDAGIAESAATFTDAELDDRDGTAYYDLDFTADGQRYEYDIDAVTGTVIATGQNTNDHQTSGAAGTTAVDEAKAKEIALAKAPSGASVVRCHLDWDDGRYIYEIKMVSGTMEYECDINAATGVITDWDVDSIYD